jgi:hypothetical protein
MLSRTTAICPATYGCEPLERRMLLTTLTINGTGGDDTIVIDYFYNNSSGHYDLMVSINDPGNGFHAYSLSTVTDVIVDGLAGNDGIIVERSIPSRPLTVSGGADDDRILVPLMGTLTDPLSITGAGGNDEIEANFEEANSSDYDYTVTAQTVSQTNGGFNDGTFGYSDIERMSLHGTTRDSVYGIGGTNTFNVNSTSPATSYSLFGRTGHDTLNFGSGNLDSVQGSVEFFDDGDPDTINLNDGAATSDQTYDIAAALFDYDINPSMFGRTSSAPLTVYGVPQRVVVNSGSGRGTFNVSSTNINTAVTINAGDGGDSLIWGNGNLDYYGGPLTFDGGAGLDGITVNDSVAYFNDTYTITSTTFTREVSALLTYVNAEGLTVNAEPGSNLFNVTSTSAATPLVINAGAGNDTLNWGNPANGDLDLHAGSCTFDGQSGTDNVWVNDMATNDSDAYKVTATAFTRTGAAPVTYANIEGMVISAEGGANTFDVTAPQLAAPLTINAGSGNDLLRWGGGDLALQGADCIFNGQGDVDSVVVNDAASSSNDSYTITYETITRVGSKLLWYENAESLTVNAAWGNNTFGITSTRATTPVVLNGGDGNDTFLVGGVSPGVLDGIQGALTLNGQGGASNRVFVFDSNSATARTYTLTRTALSGNGFATIAYGTIQTVVLTAGSAGDTFNVNSTPAGTSVYIFGNGGADSLTAGGGKWDRSVLAHIAFDGGVGTDSLRILDTDDTGTDTYTITGSRTGKNSTSSTINYSAIESYRLDANQDSNTIIVQSTFNSNNIFVNGNIGDDTIRVDSNQGTVVVDGGQGRDTVRVNGTAVVAFATAQDLASLEVRATAAASVAPGAGPVNTRSLSIDPGAKLDLTDNDMILDYTTASQLAVVQALINAARHGGAWDRTGLTSSTAAANPSHNTTLGAMEASDYKAIYGTFATFDGTATDTSAVLVKYTYYGDADFSGSVDATDETRAQNGLNQGLSGWVNGDFDGNGVVDAADITLLNLGLNTQGPPL